MATPLASGAAKAVNSSSRTTVNGRNDTEHLPHVEQYEDQYDRWVEPASDTPSHVHDAVDSTEAE